MKDFVDTPARQELVEEIERTKKEIKIAGFIHKRDLNRHLHYLQKELATYDFYQVQARKDKAARPPGH